MDKLRGCFSMVWRASLPRRVARLSNREWMCVVVTFWSCAVALLWWGTVEPLSRQLETFNYERKKLARTEVQRLALEQAHEGAYQSEVSELSEGARRSDQAVVRAAGSQVMRTIYSAAAEVGLQLKDLVQDERCVFRDRSVSVGYQVRARGAYRTFEAFSAHLSADPVPIVMTAIHFALGGTGASDASLEAELCLVFVSKL